MNSKKNYVKIENNLAIKFLINQQSQIHPLLHN
jgi:hypothetical protein